ncbi:peptide chain release factor N(5)-glutamine methyltransferase [Rhodocytophaga aerolata]|uniref:Release factor glutamine methyltransferase n=1 Tax=Rhodocytophaga aerolata TaxID=455078 RepID=A0ABT8R9N8_9BACT|nr:peptide chain release factor N(5)-glutamine methyltransferase [Rhodocytophaga aerolata]MDO1448818.1 peptide chain release factor N(5)-glutamine methyltransferase [Rhodocytophaga aerolata]
MNYSSRQLLHRITLELQPIYDTEEARSMAFLLLEHFYGLTRSAVLTDKILELPETFQLENALERLKKHEPIQYIIGSTEFMGRVFEVNRHVLIPRPETEELVNLIIEENRHMFPSKLVDIGTGSGCIAVSLAAAWPKAEILAVDVSPEALQVAKKNAEKYVQNVRFMQASILDTQWQADMDAMELDIVVSNPPYVTYAEEPLMRKNVTEHEPRLALFVENNDPLLFYRHIAWFCKRHLKKEGMCYVEINEQYGEEVKQLFLGNGFSTAVVLQDMFGKNRFVKGIQ